MECCFWLCWSLSFFLVAVHVFCVVAVVVRLLLLLLLLQMMMMTMISRSESSFLLQYLFETYLIPSQIQLIDRSESPLPLLLSQFCCCCSCCCWFFYFFFLFLCIYFFSFVNSVSFYFVHLNFGNATFVTILTGKISFHSCVTHLGDVWRNSGIYS